MKDKIITVTLSIILFVIPILIVPSVYFRGHYNFLKIIALLICGFILLLITLTRIDKLKFDKIDIPILIFGILAILSTIFSVNPYKSIIGESNRYEGLLTIITYILIYYNSKYYFKNYKYFINIASIIYIFICIFAIIQFYLKNNIRLIPIFGSGASGTFGNTNFMGSFISIILPCFVLGSIFKNRKIFYIGSIVSFSAMIMCVARSSWIAFITSMLAITIYLIISKKKIYWKRFIIIFACFILCFVGINLSDSRKSIQNKINKVGVEITQAINNGIANKMGSGRIEIWKMSVKLIEENPFLGCGIDAFRDELELQFPNYLETTDGYVDKAHNEYLQIAATMGIPALISYLIFIGIIVIKGFKNMFKHKIIAIYTITIISYLVQAFFNISTIGIAPIFWFTLGMISRHIKPKEKAKTLFLPIQKINT